VVGSHTIVEWLIQRSNDKCVNVEFIDSWFVTIMREVEEQLHQNLQACR
jgi:hypothetical protein